MADHIVTRYVACRYMTGYENVTAGATVDPASSNVSIAGADSSGSNRVIIAACAHAIDATGFQGSTSWASDDADVTGEGLFAWANTLTGVGGGLSIGVGSLASSGSSGTFTSTIASSTKQATASMALVGTQAVELYDQTTNSGTDNVTCTAPIYGGGFYLLLFVQTANEPVATPSGGWTLIKEIGVGTAAASGSTRLTIFGADADTVSDDTPTITYAATSITGTATPTIAAVTSSATGELDIVGTVNATIGAVTLSALGNDPNLEGTVDATIGAVTSSATGALAIAGTVNATIGAVTLASSQGLPLGVGGHGSGLTIYGTTNDGTTETEAFTTEASGSVMLVCVGRPSATTSAPTDNYSNTYTQIGTTHAYTVSSSWSTSLWADLTAAGGASHVVTSEIPQGDEVTICAVEVTGATRIEDHDYVYRASASSVTSATITTTAPAVLVAWWWGEGPVGQDMTASPGGDWTVVESQLVNNNNGWIQMACAVREVTTPGDYSVTWTATPTQAANLYIVAVQAVEGRVAAASPTIGAVTLSAEATIVTAATMSATLGAVTSTATGNLAIAGVAEPTIGAVSSAATGAVAISGVTDATIGAVASTAAGELDIAGAVAATLGEVTSTAAGTLPIAGATSATIGPVTLAADAYGDLAGDLAATIGAVTSTATGAVRIAASATPTIAAVTATAVASTFVDHTASVRTAAAVRRRLTSTRRRRMFSKR